MTARKFRFVLLAAIIVAIGAVGAGSYFGVTYLRQQVAAADKVKIEAEVNSLASTDATRAQQQLDDPRIARLANYLEDIIPMASYREQFIADVSKYAIDSGVPLASLTYSKGGAAPPIKGAVAIPIAITAGQVPYRNFINFVKKLENNVQHVQVVTINLLPSDKDLTLLQLPTVSIALYVETAGAQP